MITITQVTAEGFRAFMGERSVEFRTPVVLLFGENGTGKSSTLNALEWCLFGKECVGAGTGIRERVGWEVANRFASPLHVRVTVAGDTAGQKFTLTRSLVPVTGGRLRETLELGIKGESLVADEAELRLERLLACSFRDFQTICYQHQEAIRAILIQEARDRNDAVDRLLGLADYRNVLTGIDGAKVAKAFKDISGEKDRIAHDIDFAIRQRKGELEELQRIAGEAGAKDTDTTDEGATTLARLLEAEVTTFRAESGLLDDRIELPKSSNDLGDFCRSIRRSLNQARAAIPGLTRQDELVSRRSAILRLQQALKTLDADTQSVKKTLREYERAHESRESAMRRIDELQQQENELEAQLRQLDVRAPLVKEGIELLENGDGYLDRCPLCGSTVADLLGQLQAEWDSRIGIEAENLRGQIEAVGLQKDDVEEVLHNWTTASTKADELKAERSRLRRSMSETLDVPIDAIADPAGDLAKELASVQASLDSMEQTVSAKMESIDGLEDDLRRVEIVDSLLTERRKVAEIDRIYQSDEFERLESGFAEVAQFAADVDRIKEAIAAAANAEAEAKVKAAGSVIDEYFRETANHQGLQRVSLEVEPDTRTGRNSYTFVDESGDNLLPALNQGAMNCLALSIFLGLSSALSDQTPLNFVLLDDPSQSLGSDEKRRLARLLNSISERVGIIVATMDEEFRASICDMVPEDKLTTYYFRDWSPKGGPIMEEAGRA